MRAFDKKKVVVFPAAGHDVNTVRPDMAHEVSYVRAAGGDIVILDMEEMARGNVVASGILNEKMARDYDHCDIDDNDVEAYRTANQLEPLAYDAECFFRFPEPVSGDFYQLMRWKLGIRLVEAVLNTADYERVQWYLPYEPVKKALGFVNDGEPNQRQWWVDGRLVMVIPADYSSLEDATKLSSSFTDRLERFVSEINMKFVVVDVVKGRNGRWAVSGIRDGQTTPLPENRDLTFLFSALVNYRTS